MKPAIAMIRQWMADDDWIERSAWHDKEIPELAIKVVLPHSVLLPLVAKLEHQPHTIIAFVQAWEFQVTEKLLGPQWSESVTAP